MATITAPQATPGDSVSAASPRAHSRNLNWSIIGISAGLVALAFAIYLRTLHNGFISYDDYDYITANALVRGGLSWHSIARALTSVDQANWFPMEWISLMGTAQWFGLNPAAFHFTNLILHATNVVLLFLLLHKATGKTWRAATVAALFAVLPLNVEAVAWATERKSVLSVFFLLLSFAAYGWYVRKPGLFRYALIALPFALGLMTKAWLVTFPFTLLLLDCWPLRRFGSSESTDSARGSQQLPFTRLALEKLPLLLMSSASTAVGIYAARAGGALQISTAQTPMGLRAENALWSYVMYIAKGIWPAHLAIIYPFPQHYYTAWQIAMAAGLLLTITGIVWRLRERRYLIVGWLWYLGVLFPVIGLVQTGTQSMADRWAYISFWGLFVATVWLIADWADSVQLPRPTLAVIAACIIGAYAARSYIQTGYWHDDFTVYTHTIDATKVNGPARVNLGIWYEQRGRPDLALQQDQQAVIDMPSLGIAHYNLARLLAGRNDSIEAIAEYQLAISNTAVPHEIAGARVGLGGLYVRMNLPSKALDEFSAALAANPNDVYALLDRGMIEFRQENLAAARSDFTRATQVLPTAMTWYTLGLIQEREGDYGAAVESYGEALRMNPSLDEAREALGKLRTGGSH